MTSEVSEVPRETRGVNGPHRVLRSFFAVVIVVAALAVLWTYRYNPLAQSWDHAKGEWGSYVGTNAGVRAHFTTTEAPGTPMGTLVWDEPRGKFLVQFETEVTNTGSHAVRIVAVGEPSFDYRTSAYGVSFYQNAPFPYEGGASFHPFTLTGHSQKMLTVSYTQFCTTSASYSLNGRAMPSGPTALPVTYSFLGFTHTDEVPVAPFIFVAPQRC
ncbi:MAG TPA: hypothetical protein VMU98_01000 [Acidimicrobiales bacterium]|nr:hypothetical protein [Acidimicrobiales bacterium]